MKLTICALTAAATLAACAPPPPTSPAEATARSAAAYDYTARNCGGLVGGFNDAVAMQQQAKARYAAAVQLGASEAMIQAQKKVVENTGNTAIALIGKPSACQQMVSEAAAKAV